MGKSLLIVESPAKARTIHKYLGSNFTVKASVGHIKDLPPKKLGVDIEENFAPEYVTIRGKGKVIQELKSAAKKADTIYLAPDPDREGEAICWHIAEELKKAKNVTNNIYRVMFNEITKKAISEAIKQPGTIDNHKVDAQQARRILDRLVGYKISPLLWKKVQKGLSAGRVQSVALRLICEREKEIQAFTPEEYWSITARLSGSNPPPFEAKLLKIQGKKAKIANEDEATALTDRLKPAQYVVEKITRKEKRRKPVAPFTTSTLQQEAARKLRFSAKKTMTLAQKLYEGVEIGEEEPVGLITYMRTDSTRISAEALTEVREYIKDTFGKPYLPAKPHAYKTQKAAQEAHEAIRPTSVLREPDKMKAYLSHDEARLYTLIWKRIVASQMKPAVLDVTTIDVKAADCLFRATGSVIKFLGFMKLYIEGTDDQDEQGNGKSDKPQQDKDMLLPQLQEGEVLTLLDLLPKQHFTQPPPRYTEATLVKELEKCGIGRPSTYATILSTIEERQYVTKDRRKFIPSELGMLVTDLLVENFPKILDVGFTANLEEQLDQIEEGKLEWTDSLHNFYQPFSRELERAAKEMRNIKKEREEVTDIKCEKCGEPMVIKFGRYGKFLACSGFPKCRNTKPIETLTGQNGPNESAADGAAADEPREVCEKCGKPMVMKRGRYGAFLACSGYPECKNTKKIVQGQNGEKKVEQVVVSDQKCEKCGANMVIREGRYGKFLSCSNYPKCKFIKPMGTGVTCPEPDCDGELVQRRTKGRKTFYGCSNYPKCKYTIWFKPVPRPCPKCQAPFLIEKWDKETESTFVTCYNEQCDYVEA